MKNKENDHKPDGFDNVETNQTNKQLKKECLRLLARREHSRKQLLDKLTIKGYEGSKINAVLDHLALQNWQSDARYAQSYARVRFEKGFGLIRIAYELRQNGIDQETVNQTIQALPASSMTLLEQVYRKKYSKQLSVDSAERAKRSRFLLQRGFASKLIHDFFNHTISKST